VVGDYQFFDNGYLWMLFIGGVPTLLCYGAIIVWPAIQAFSRRPRGLDGAAVFLVLTWGVALTGLSTFTLPSVSLNSFLMALWAGRCHVFLAGKRGPRTVAWRRLPVPAARPRFFGEPGSGVAHIVTGES
jgi:O-antigen ligase